MCRSRAHSLSNIVGKLFGYKLSLPPLDPRCLAINQRHYRVPGQPAGGRGAATAPTAVNSILSSFGAPRRALISPLPVDFPMSVASRSFDHIEMKSSKPKEWTQAERKRLAWLARRRVVSEIAAALGRHTGSVRRMARAMGLILKR